jgi:KDEL-tailed cysteine endopeptidase
MKVQTIIAILAVGAAVSLGLFVRSQSLQAVAPSDAAFTSWLAQFKKVYRTPAEKAYRRTVFLKNLQLVRELNKAHTYESGLNEFSDMAFEEFKAKYTGVNIPENEEKVYADLSGIEQAASVNWVTAGAVNPIKNQGQCGSCWAFSATSAIESANKIAGNALLSLSEQQMVDCAGGLYGNQGCNGGWMNRAFFYIKTVGGQELETTYPYTGQDNSCKFKKANVKASIKGYTDLPAKDCNALATAVNSRPVAIAVEVTAPFQAYKSGVFSDTTCKQGGQVNHAINVVGYATWTDGTPYWNVRNSWGTTWGQNGYILMNRSLQLPNGLCGVCDYATYPSI